MLDLDEIHAAETVLERDVRLSKSAIWRLQRAFFEQQGVEAWRLGTVPHYITSNPFIAESYARVVLAFLRDCEASHDPSQPVYIVELGSGSGRFAYHFLQAIVPLARRHGAPAVRFVYVMTDFAAATLAFWRSHPSLAPLVAAGVLDFARFDVEHDHALTLLNSGEVLRAGALNNPLVVLANYFFDGLPQDVLLLAEGRLHEGLVTLTSRQPEPDPDDPALLARAHLSYRYRPIDGDYLGDPELDAILGAYRRRLGRTTIRFPTAALACCQSLRRLAGGRLLLLSADKGTLREADLVRRDPPQMVVHGSFSLDVDYHALAELFRGLGGEALLPTHGAGSLAVAAFLLGRAPGAHPATADAFTDAIDRFGPDEFFALKKAIEPIFDRMSIVQLVALLRLARGDTRIARQVLPALIERAEDASERERVDLIDLVELVWRSYYHLGEEQDLAFQLGVLLMELAAYPEALRHHERSVALYGPDASTSYNIALCRREMCQLDEAWAAVEEALQLNPDHDEARALRIELEAPRMRR